MGEPRTPRASKPSPPPPDVVARRALALPEDDPARLYLASVPAVAWWLTFYEARRLFEGLRSAGIGTVEAAERVGRRIGYSGRQVREWASMREWKSSPPDFQPLSADCGA